MAANLMFIHFTNFFAWTQNESFLLEPGMVLNQKKKLSKLRRLWHLSHTPPAKAQASLHSLARALAVHRHNIEVDEGADQNSDI